MIEVTLEGLMDAAKALEPQETVTFKITDAPDSDWVYAEAQKLLLAGFMVDVEGADNYEIEVTGR